MVSSQLDDEEEEEEVGFAEGAAEGEFRFIRFISASTVCFTGTTGFYRRPFIKQQLCLCRVCVCVCVALIA